MNYKIHITNKGIAEDKHRNIVLRCSAELSTLFLVALNLVSIMPTSVCLSDWEYFSRHDSGICFSFRDQNRIIHANSWVMIPGKLMLQQLYRTTYNYIHRNYRIIICIVLNSFNFRIIKI